MKRIIIAATIALLMAITLFTAFIQDNLLQAFTAADPLSQGVRVLIIGLLATLLLTSPPRSNEFRLLLSIASAALMVGVAILLPQNQMPLLDAVLFVEVAIILMLESVESPVLAKTTGKKIPVIYRPQNEKIRI